VFEILTPRIGVTLKVRGRLLHFIRNDFQTIKINFHRFIYIVAILQMLTLTACQPATIPTQPLVEKDPVASLQATETGLPAGPGPDLESQAQSLLPEYAGDLDELAGLPYYYLQVEIEPEAHTFQGRMTLDYTNQEMVELDRLYLRLYPNGGLTYGNGQLVISNLFLDGQPVEPRLSLSDSVLEVPLPVVLPQGNKTSLSLDFSGRVPVNFGDGESSTAYGIFNFSEGVLALASWYPILAVYDQEGWNLDPVTAVGDAVYSDMAFYSVQVTLPVDHVLAATGIELDRVVSGQDAMIRLVSGPARDFFLITSPHFVSSSEQVNGAMLNVYTMGDLPEARQFMLEVAVESLKTFNQSFGAYPYRELDIVQAPMRNAGGVEFPGIVLIEAGRSLDQRNPVLATTVAHEVAHQWWYNLVGNDVIDEPWLDEALATYSSLLYWEQVHGDPGYQAVLSDFQSLYTRAEINEVQGEINDGIDFYSMPEFGRGFGAVVYFKGALFFHALRQEIGDEAFFAALQQYYRGQRYGIASGEDLLSSFEITSGRSLTDFYREWLRVEGN
jgi:hypothetical protein